MRQRQASHAKRWNNQFIFDNDDDKIRMQTEARTARRTAIEKMTNDQSQFIFTFLRIKWQFKAAAETMRRNDHLIKWQENVKSEENTQKIARRRKMKQMKKKNQNPTIGS